MNDREVTLREYIEMRIKALETKVDDGNRTAQVAVERALTANEKRFDATNEWRATLNDVVARLVTRSEWGFANDAVQGRIGRLEKTVWMCVGGIVVLEVVLRLWLRG